LTSSGPDTPNVFCIDVGSHRNIGWADGAGNRGSFGTLADALGTLGRGLRGGQRVALGFEAPIWTPRRTKLEQLTRSRGGAERSLRRAWSAGAGCGSLAAGLALMPWCLAELFEASGPVAATISADRFTAGASQLMVWEALVTGKAKGLTHHEDAALAVAAFQSRYPDLRSDVPGEPAINHAAVALQVTGFTIAFDELGEPGTVLCVPAKVIPASPPPLSPRLVSPVAAAHPARHDHVIPGVLRKSMRDLSGGNQGRGELAPARTHQMPPLISSTIIPGFIHLKSTIGSSAICGLRQKYRRPGCAGPPQTRRRSVVPFN
jgi:hypothetical protein